VGFIQFVIVREKLSISIFGVAWNVTLQLCLQRRTKYSPSAIPPPATIANPRKYLNKGTPTKPIVRKPKATIAPAIPPPTRSLCIVMP
jgi:hypothetical protein